MMGRDHENFENAPQMILIYTPETHWTPKSEMCTDADPEQKKTKQPWYIFYHLGLGTSGYYTLGTAEKIAHYIVIFILYLAPPMLTHTFHKEFSLTEK